MLGLSTCFFFGLSHERIGRRRLFCTYSCVMIFLTCLYTSIHPSYHPSIHSSILFIQSYHRKCVSPSTQLSMNVSENVSKGLSVRGFSCIEHEDQLYECVSCPTGTSSGRRKRNYCEKCPRGTETFIY